MPAKRCVKGKKQGKNASKMQAEKRLSQPQHQPDESPTSHVSRESTPSTSSTHSPTQPNKKTKVVTDLTVAQEEEMASWLEENELLYNKKLNAYKDYKKKDALWESKAASMGKDVQVLKIWYRSIRTRFTRLVHRKSGDGASEFTERDQWILTNFSWLKVHVIEVPKKTKVSMKEKIATAASLDDENDDHSANLHDIETETTTPQHLESLSHKSSTSTSKKTNLEEERLLSNIAAREEQTLAFQTKVLEMMAPSKATERTRYADWAKEVMVSLHPSLWLKFQRECTNLLYAYQEKSEALVNPLPQQYYTQQPHVTMQQQPQYQFYQRDAIGPSSTGVMLQTLPQQWLTTVQQNMPAWGSHNITSVQGQMTDLQPMTTMVCESSLPASSISNTVANQSESPLCLATIIRDTIVNPDTSTENAVTTVNK